MSQTGAPTRNDPLRQAIPRQGAALRTVPCPRRWQERETGDQRCQGSAWKAIALFRYRVLAPDMSKPPVLAR